MENSKGVQKRWLVGQRDAAAEARLSAELGISSLVSAILVSRGITDPATAHTFLNPSLSDLHNPELLPDYTAARDQILGARERKETIFIHGDYDVDGVTSAALLSRFLTKIGCSVVTHVPHRMKEGYGIHASAVDAAAASGAKLFLTCDCGGSAIEQVERARAAGMSVVVTDHHSIGDVLPNAQAFVNPHRDDSQYPFAELSGVGVAFKLCEGLTGELGIEKKFYYNHYLDLAALGTIADVMPLENENRIIARFGLQRLGETKKVGLRAMMSEAKIAVGEKMRGYHVGFVLGPRLNAAGRVDDAALALRLLLTSDEFEATKLASEIEAKNLHRREEQQRILGEAVEMVEASGAHERNIIVIAKEGWHTGVIGIVAGRLVELYRRPTIVLSVDEHGNCKGSARSIPKFHLANAIYAHPELLSGGGHAMAAGCAFPQDRFEEVVKALDDYAGERLGPEDFVSVMEADIEVDPAEVTLKAAQELAQMEPFGCGNPEPTFVARGMSLAEVTPTRNPDHVRTLLRSTAGSVVAMGFNMGERICAEMIGQKMDVAFEPMVDEWRGRMSLKWRIRDLGDVSAVAIQPAPEESESSVLVSP